MRSEFFLKTAAALLLVSTLIFTPGRAEEVYLFQGQVNADNINIRCDSTTSAEIICTVNRGERLDITAELYDWYKVRLPIKAPSFVKSNLVECVKYSNILPEVPFKTEVTHKKCLSAKAAKNHINVRLRPDESSPILGQIDQNEIINILEKRQDWFKIEPINNSFGWVHKNFLNKVAASAGKIPKKKVAVERNL